MGVFCDILLHVFHFVLKWLLKVLIKTFQRILGASSFATNASFPLWIDRCGRGEHASA